MVLYPSSFNCTREEVLTGEVSSLSRRDLSIELFESGDISCVLEESSIESASRIRKFFVSSGSAEENRMVGALLEVVPVEGNLERLANCSPASMGVGSIWLIIEKLGGPKQLKVGKVDWCRERIFD